MKYKGMLFGALCFASCGIIDMFRGDYHEGMQWFAISVCAGGVWGLMQKVGA